MRDVIFENKVNNIALDLCLLVSFTKNKISKAISCVSSLSQEKAASLHQAQTVVFKFSKLSSC